MEQVSGALIACNLSSTRAVHVDNFTIGMVCADLAMLAAGTVTQCRRPCLLKKCFLQPQYLPHLPCIFWACGVKVETLPDPLLPGMRSAKIWAFKALCQPGIFVFDFFYAMHVQVP